jgi:hypothetical protein
VTLGFGVAVGSCERSLMVTFTFCPGRRLSISTFALDPDGFGAISTGFFVALDVDEGFGVGVDEGFGVGC